MCVHMMDFHVLLGCKAGDLGHMAQKPYSSSSCLKKNEPVGSVHAKSFSSCQSQTFLPGTLLHLFPGEVFKAN